MTASRTMAEGSFIYCGKYKPKNAMTRRTRSFSWSFNFGSSSSNSLFLIARINSIMLPLVKISSKRLVCVIMFVHLYFILLICLILIVIVFLAFVSFLQMIEGFGVYPRKKRHVCDAKQ